MFNYCISRHLFKPESNLVDYILTDLHETGLTQNLTVFDKSLSVSNARFALNEICNVQN